MYSMPILLLLGLLSFLRASAVAAAPQETRHYLVGVAWRA